MVAQGREEVAMVFEQACCIVVSFVNGQSRECWMIRLGKWTKSLCKLWLVGGRCKMVV